MTRLQVGSRIRAEAIILTIKLPRGVSAMLRLLLLLSVANVLSSCASQTASNKKSMFGTGWEASAFTCGEVGTGR
jgi:hypothetical protein